MSGKAFLSVSFLLFGVAAAAHGAVISCPANVVNNAKARVQDHDPALAWNGKNFGMVWVTDGDNLMFALLGADGKRVAGPRLLYDAHVPFLGYTVEYPDIVWTGSSFLVVYSDGYYGRTYFSMQVNAAGSVLNGPVNLRTEPSWTYEWAGSLSWNGSEAGFVYVNQDTKVYFKRLSKTGALIGKPVVVASNAGCRQFGSYFAKVAWNGKAFGVAWITTKGKSIAYQAVSAAGAPTGNRATIAKTGGEFLFLSLCPGKTGSETFGTAFTEHLLNVREVVYFTQVEGNGTLVHKPVNVRGVPRTSYFVGDYPFVAWNAARSVFHVAWQDNRVEPKPDSYVTSYYNFFMRSIKPDGKFASAETMLNASFKDPAYNTLESGAAFGGTKLCIGFSKSMSLNVTDPDQRHYRAHSVCVTPR